MDDKSMDNDNLVLRERSHLYSRETDNGDKISIIINAITQEITTIGKRIELNDTELVRETTMRYLESCGRTGCLPTKIGLARACGITSRALGQFCSRHPDHPTTNFLQVVFETFGEALSQASLNGSAHPIVSIFLQKALYGIRENDPIEAPKEDVLGEITDPRAIMDKYSQMDKYEDDYGTDGND